MHPFLFTYDLMSFVIPRSLSDIRSLPITSAKLYPVKRQTCPQESRHSKEPKRHQESTNRTHPNQTNKTTDITYKNPVIPRSLNDIRNLLSARTQIKPAKQQT
uniref:Uncharacterized protein n=1 Tax=Vibrio parahaemolyticus TaxID=670 RepID=A0A7M1VVY1_VIBPH|nr:hypothetical protein VP36_00036 [Vibrio parahaemolyticus]QOS21312.1 hypothetical protein VP321_00035 [Vibrio parahaemolyticus]